MSDTQEQGAPASDRTVPIEPPKDQFGNPVEVDTSKFPDDSPAAQGQTTPPSGQGGASPHDGISYQDKFPPNPPPSESAAEKGAENDRIARGEVTDVGLANEKLASITGSEPEPTPEPQPVSEPQPQPEQPQP